MKKAFILLFVSVVMMTLTTKADDLNTTAKTSIDKIADNTLRHFGSTFYRASDVNWTMNKSYQKASFVLNGKTSTAIYDYDHQLLVATQNVKFDELPLKAQENLKESYKNFRVSKVVKVLNRPSDYQYNDDTNHFWLSLFTDNKEIILMISPNAEISTVSTKALF